MKTSFITLLLLIPFPGRGLIRWQSFIWYGCTHYNFLQHTTWWLIELRAETWHAALLFRENISAGASSNLFGGRDYNNHITRTVQAFSSTDPRFVLNKDNNKGVAQNSSVW